MIIMVAGVRFISATNDHRSLFGENNPYLVAFDALEKTYAESNTVFIAIAPKGGSVFTKEALGAIEELTEAAWKTPHSSRVDSLTNYNHSRAEGDDLIVEPLVDDASALTDADLARIKKIALNASDIAGRLVSHDGRVGGVAIRFVMPEDSDASMIEITDYVNALADKARARNPNMAYYLTGDVFLSRALAKATEYDVQNLVPIMFLIVVVATAVLLRSVVATLAVVTTFIFTVNTTMGFAGWIGTIFSPANAVVPIIVITVAVAHTIHIATTTLFGMMEGQDKKAAIAESLRHNAWPVFLSSATTAIGFLSLNTSESPPFRVLGNLVAFGVMCTYIYSMTLLPALLSILPLRAPRHRSGRPGFFERFGDFVVERSKFLILFVSLLAIILSLGIFRIVLTDNWTLYLDERYQFRRDTDFVIENLTGLESMEYSLQSGREGGITDPEYLKKVEAFAEWYRKQPDVSHVQAFSDIMKRLNKNMHGDDPAFYKIPEDPKLAAQYLLLYEFSLPFGMDLNDRIDVAKSATRMTVQARGRWSSSQQRALDARAQSWLQTNAPQLATQATGLSVATAYLSQRNINSMLSGMSIAMGLISLILLFVFKSVRLGLISLIPNFIPLTMGFGLWGYIVGQLGLGGTVTSVIAFGIIVDDTIHFLSKYQQARHDGLTVSEAVRHTLRSVGHALWTTTVVLCAGFLVLALSGFESSWTLGILVAITLMLALLADFLLLPPLLLATEREKG